jgi:hypothetical protein
MLFTVNKPRLLWDNWLFFWKGKYYLYYLANVEGEPWDRFGLAISDDTLQWKDLGDIMSKDPKAVWMGTGHVWKSPAFDDDGKFIINYSQWYGHGETGQQYIYFAESTDLIHWRKLDTRFEPDPRWYNANKGGESRWDTINPLPRPGGGYYGFWTATPSDHPAGIGFGESDDGVTWHALPPPKIDWGNNPVPPYIEIGGVEKFGGKYYNMVGTIFRDGRRGMLLLVADDPAGPYVAARRNHELLTSHYEWTYYSRFFPGPDGLYVNYQAIEDMSRVGGTRTVHVAPIKRAVLDDAGTFFLGYWERTNGLKGKKQLAKLEPVTKHGDYTMWPFQSRVNLKTGMVIEGTIPVPTDDEELVGIYFEVEVQHVGDHVWLAVLVGRGGTLRTGIIDPMDNTFEELDSVARPHSFGKPACLRLLVRGAVVEVYLADILLQGVTMPLLPTGKMGFVSRHLHAPDLARFETFTTWTMKKNY